jgi:hypothetical protein
MTSLLSTSEDVVHVIKRDEERRSGATVGHSALAILGDMIHDPENPEKSTQRAQRVKVVVCEEMAHVGRTRARDIAFHKRKFSTAKRAVPARCSDSQFW